MQEKRHILEAAMLAAVISLAAAFTAQYGFGLTPCHLCIAQRIPFAFVILLALIGLAKTSWRSVLILLIALSFFIDSGIASYHAAVEKHWVNGPSGCTNGEAPRGQSDDDFLKRIQSAPIVACDTPQWEYHGLTMAGMNAIWCLGLCAMTLIAWRKAKGREKAHA